MTAIERDLAIRNFRRWRADMLSLARELARGAVMKDQWAKVAWMHGQSDLAAGMACEAAHKWLFVWQCFRDARSAHARLISLGDC